MDNQFKIFIELSFPRQGRCREIKKFCAVKSYPLGPKLMQGFNFLIGFNIGQQFNLMSIECFCRLMDIG